MNVEDKSKKRGRRITPESGLLRKRVEYFLRELLSKMLLKSLPELRAE